MSSWQPDASDLVVPDVPYTIGAGKVAEAIGKKLTMARGTLRSPSLSNHGEFAIKSTDPEIVFRNSADLKIMISQISAHMTPEERHTLYRRIDFLLDLDEWDDSDVLIRTDSFKTFLRMMLFIRCDIIPSLGVSDEGLLLVAWQNEGATLSVKCLPEDRIEWAFLAPAKQPIKCVSGKADVRGFPAVLDRSAAFRGLDRRK